MKTTGNILNQRLIRPGTMLSLIFFGWLFAITCKQKESDKIAVVWNDSIPEGVAIPLRLLNNVREHDYPALIRVRLQDKTIDILGEFKPGGDQVVFMPPIPFTPGMHYEVVFRDKVIGRFTVSRNTQLAPPALEAIYPSADTLPANLLKFYLVFSDQMREGEALHHIQLLNDRGDTLPDVFLQLQPELWNPERTALTVWIDPGRIKRELVPNKTMGNPLDSGSRYILHISGAWKNIHGLPLQRSVRKEFLTCERDSLLPEPQRWSLAAPKARTSSAVRISFGEPLDYFLIRESIVVLDQKGNAIKGELHVSDKEAGIEFMPALPWQPGTYRVRVDARLEDLAGNNVNRPFDRDISIPRSSPEMAYFDKLFTIEQ